MEAIGSFFSPSCTNTGIMKLAGEMCVSEIAPRIVPERLLRRGREGMSCLGLDMTGHRYDCT